LNHTFSADDLPEILKILWGYRPHRMPHNAIMWLMLAAVVAGCPSTTPVNNPPNIAITDPPATVVVTSK
jgi:hypothetical protein